MAVLHSDVLRSMRRLLGIGGVTPSSHYTQLSAAKTSIHHLEIGSGPPVVLIHGAGGGSANWFRMFAPLSHRFRVLAPDLPGFGLSSSIRLEAPLGTQTAHILAEWLDGVGVHRAHIVGTSFGGLAAMRFSQHFPPRIGRLVLIDTAGAGREAHPLIAAAGLPFATLLLRPSRRGTRLLLRRVLLHRRIDCAIEDALVDYLYASATAAGPRYMVDALRAFIAGRRWQAELPTDAELERITAPALVVWGARDRFFPRRHGASLVKRLPDATEAVIEDAGHSPNWEKPDELAALLLRFLDND